MEGRADSKRQHAADLIPDDTVALFIKYKGETFAIGIKLNDFPIEEREPAFRYFFGFASAKCIELGIIRRPAGLGELPVGSGSVPAPGSGAAGLPVPLSIEHYAATGETDSKRAGRPEGDKRGEDRDNGDQDRDSDGEEV